MPALCWPLYVPTKGTTKPQIPLDLFYATPATQMRSLFANREYRMAP